MTTPQDSEDGDEQMKTDRRENRAQQNVVPQHNFERRMGSPKPVENAAADDVMSSREKSVTAREAFSLTRDESANQRDTLLQVREQALHLRELVATSREEVIDESERINAALENHISKMRKVNGQLVITAVQAQIMTEEMQKAKEQMSYMAHHDSMTGLANRILLKERLIQAIALAKRHGTKLAVLFIDLDRFKTINDSLGHAVGDKLLQAVAQRLMKFVRDTDTVSRQGGDEFILLLPEVADELAVSTLADKMSEAIIAPYVLGKQTLYIGVTIGISMYPDDGKDAEKLIHNADVAMYHAKNKGRGRYQFYRPDMNARAVERQEVEGDLRRALEQNEFRLYYQPQIELNSGKILGVEALIRWQHPVRGLLRPEAFVSIAEECGAIVPIGRWALREACRQMRAWLDAGLMLNVIGVNVSAVEFSGDDFFGHIRAVLSETGLAPHCLELELTETSLMANSESIVDMLEELKAMGVRIAIDDFGTGYSSLSYLKRFPVDTLKIDQSFVAGIVCNGIDDILVDAVIGLGKNLKHRVIAEGVETSDQLAYLSCHECAEGQGFYLCPPMDAEAFSHILKTGIPMGLFPQSSQAN